MKQILFVGLLLCTTFLKGQSIPVDSVVSYVGSLVTVCDEVTGVYASKNNVTYINFGGAYPNNKFTAVIFAKDTVNFKDEWPLKIVKGQRICVTGHIELYNEKPQIKIKSPSQIRIPDKE